MKKQLVLQTEFSDMELVARGKVRDIYNLGEALLLVTTDRISAFDVIMDEAVPGKGYVLNNLSAFWFDKMADIVPSHMISTCISDFPEVCQKYAHVLAGRSMLVKKAMPLPVECIARGYLSGSGWKDYRETGAICGIKLPTGLVESDRLSQPIFTPSTKAELGTHDENISFEEMERLCGKDIAAKAREMTLQVYSKGHDYADNRGIIIADTKFEFGVYNGELIIIDECMTPDSSRFWPKNQYEPGGPQPSFDKQFLRDYLETLDWGKTAPPPPLPPEIVAKTSEKYYEALTKLARSK